MQVPLQMGNDIFLTHLHVDHYGELPNLYAFAPWAARWKPLRVHGPSGRTPEDGTATMVENMQRMAHWHTDSFNSSAIGDGYEVEVNGFDFRDDNGICYDQDGWSSGTGAARTPRTGRRTTRRAHRCSTGSI
jgi:ribonuclease Z